MRCKLFDWNLRLLVPAVVAAAVLLSGCGAEADQEQSKLPEETILWTEAPVLETVAPDYRDAPGEAEGFIRSHPLGTMVRYDLNGDGIGEDITVNAGECTDGSVVVGDKEVLFSAIYPTGYFTILNMDRYDERLLIGVSDYGFSDDPITVLYGYDGAQITEVGYYEDITGTNAWDYTGAVCHGDGTLSARIRFDVLGTWQAMAHYALEQGQLVDIADFYEYISWDEQSDGWVVTAKMEIVTYEDIWNEETKVTVPAGTELVMMGLKKGIAEGTYWICFQAASTERYLWMEAEVIDWYTAVSTPEGFVPSEEVFDGFFYAG